MMHHQDTKMQRYPKQSIWCKCWHKLLLRSTEDHSKSSDQGISKWHSQKWPWCIHILFTSNNVFGNMIYEGKGNWVFLLSSTLIDTNSLDIHIHNIYIYIYILARYNIDYRGELMLMVYWRARGAYLCVLADRMHHVLYSEKKHPRGY